MVVCFIKFQETLFASECQARGLRLLERQDLGAARIITATTSSRSLDEATVAKARAAATASKAAHAKAPGATGTAAAVAASEAATKEGPAAKQHQQQQEQGPVVVVDVPRYSFVETAHALHYYYERGLLKDAPSEQEVEVLRGVTNGNGAELRTWCVGATQLTGMT